MKRIISLLIFALTISSNIFSQNVGIGTTTPSNTLHIVPVTPGNNPLRIEGLQNYTNEDSVLVVNPSSGVIKYMPIADVISSIPPNILDSLILNSVLNNTDTIYNNQSVIDSIISIALNNVDTLFSSQTFRDSILGVVLNNIDTIFTITRDSLLNDSTFINTLRDSVDTDIDSMIFANDTLYLYEDNQRLTAYINASTDTNLVDSLIVANSDTLYTIISDSLLQDTLWIKNLDSLLSIYGDTIYFNDSSYILVRDSLLGDTLFIDSLYTLISDSLLSDSLWLDSLGKLINDNDWDINANGTGLEAAPAGNNFASGQYAISAGFSDTATGQYSVISGGYQNKAIGSYSTVTGGYQNLAQGSYSTVGGYRDTVSGGTANAVLSGRDNKITNGAYSSIYGGYQNKLLNSSYASLNGYRSYIDNGTYSFIHGREDTIIRNLDGTFISGIRNSSIADASGGAWTGRNTIFGAENKIFVSSNNNNHSISILGGMLHEITGTPGIGTIVAGGLNNDIDGTTIWTGSSGIFAGYDNFIGGTSGSGGASGIITGRQDTLLNSGVSNIIGGQSHKITSANFAGIFSGRSNSITSAESGTILGGIYNTLHPGTNYSSIIGGDTNGIANNADNAIILGGRMNIANNFSEVVLGHYSTNTVAPGSSASTIDPDNILLKIGNGTNASNLNDAMVVKANGTVGINTSNPTNQLHIAGGTDPLRLEGLQTGGSTDSVLVTDGTGVVKKTSLNSITRVCGGYTFTNLEGETVVSHGLFCTFTTPTYTLPAANLTTGRKFVVKLQTNPATSATVTAVSGNIDGAASYDMLAAGLSSVILQSDGANYWIIGSH